MQQVLKDIPDANLMAYIIWLPVLPSDDLEAAIERSGEFSDPRVTYFWDSNLLTGKLWKPILDIPRQVAWDVYLIYDAKAQWKDKLPPPDFWMHQLGGVTKAPQLEVDGFEKKARKMLGALN